MLKFYGDNTAFQSSPEAEIEDIILFGGILIHNDNEPQLIKRIEEIRIKYGGFRRAPLKYNFKDLKKVYTASNCAAQYAALLGTSREWRTEIFNALSESSCKILVSCIESHETKKRDIINRRNDLTGYMFSNLLMRLGLEQRSRRLGPGNSSLECQIVLDWPEGDDPKIFNSEYARAFNRGSSVSGVSFTSGALANLGFKDSILYGVMENTALLQVSDLVVGACKEFTQCCVGTKPPTVLGVQLTKLACARFRDFPNTLNKGIIVSNQNRDLKRMLQKGITDHLIA